MMYNWDLSKLYCSTDSKEFKDDLNKLKEAISDLDKLSTNLNNMETNDALVKCLKLLSEFNVLVEKLGHFVSLILTTETTNQEVTSVRGNLYELLSDSAKSTAAIELWIKDLDFNNINFEDKYLNEHKFYLNEIKENGRYLLSEDIEAIIAKLVLNASNKWSDLQEYLTSTLSIEIDGKEYNLPSVRNMAYDSDPSVRKKAYEAEIAAYDKIKDPLAFALNSIKGEAISISKLRSYDSVLDMTLKSSRLKKETLDAMLESMHKALPHFRRYLKAKAKLLNQPNGLPFYDMFAPIGSSETKFTVEESKEFLVKTYEEIEDIAKVVEEAYDNNWIDFLPKSGKVGGAFCANLPSIKESRILTNFDGSLSSVITLAHELGHAYHGYCIQNHHPLNTGYSMPVAETASIFNETLVMNKVIKESVNADEKLALIESSLQDSTQVIVDIMSRYIFETNLIKNRETSFMFADELSNMMIEAQKEAYGDGLDQNQLHPYMWINKGHYYSAGLNFYNFPYAFGLLFAKGLYAIYQEEKESFIPKYNELLKATTISNVEDVALIAKIDLTDTKFWDNSLNIIIEQIDEFIKLASK